MTSFHKDYRSFMVALDLIPIEDLTDDEVLERFKNKNKPPFEVRIDDADRRFLHVPATIRPIEGIEPPLMRSFVRQVDHIPADTLGTYSPLDVQVTLQHMRTLTQERINP